MMGGKRARTKDVPLSDHLAALPIWEWCGQRGKTVSRAWRHGMELPSRIKGASFWHGVGASQLLF